MTTRDHAPSAPPTRPDQHPRRPDESMSLLREMLENPLDAGYGATAAREGVVATSALPWWRKALLVAACAVIAAGAVWSARELRPAQQPTGARALLVEQIDERRAEGDALAAQNEAAMREIESLRDDALAGVDEDLVERLRHLGVASGTSRVRGEGLAIELTDSAAAQAGQPGSEEERVQDVDLQVLVNGLWASGAEAIAVDGQRLSATSAIRSAGQAILVNLQPVVSPYVVEVIGDPVELQTNLSRTAAASHLNVLRDTYDITIDVRQEDELVLPGDGERTLHFARPAGQDDVAEESAGVEDSEADRDTGTGGPDGEVS
ncbi:DUF881 domain-containing protein [Georgenia sp. AZ-5]|uniref:DUF881 domain-containing protein n=1 Tax=Georgenia sp. AZ-5 TaxID=3367526 RepID=UPI0037542122